jgi:hypothetical protein
VPAVESTKHLIELMEAQRIALGMTYNQTKKASGQHSQNLLNAVRNGDTTVVFRQILDLINVLDADLVFVPRPKKTKVKAQRDQMRAARQASLQDDVQDREAADFTEPDLTEPDFTDPNDPVRIRVEQDLDAIYEMTSGWREANR